MGRAPEPLMTPVSYECVVNLASASPSLYVCPSRMNSKFL